MQWYFTLEDNPDEDSILCPFCKKAMETDVVRSTPDGWTENVWLCVNPSCFRRSVVKLGFELY